MDLSTALNKYQLIDSAVQAALLRVMKPRSLPKGTILLTEGQVIEEVYFIEKGLIRGFYYQDKKEITSWMANEGRFIWPLPSYLLRQPSRENIQLLEPTTVLSIERQEVERLKRDHAVFDNLQDRIMERYIVLYDLRVRLLLMKAEHRFDAYQQLFPELYRRVPLRYIATYLGIDPATLSRLRSGYKIKSGAKKN
jgi:CRP-like cAMP-binding protein